MKAEQIDQALHQRFVRDGERLVFWHDPEGEFREYVDDGLPGALGEVQVLDVAGVGGLSAKLLLERQDPTGQYLVYSTGEPPVAEGDWLLDIRLYSAQFHADVASLWVQELGLAGLHLRDHLRARSAFMANKDRRKRLKRLVGATDDEAALDLKMIAVVVASPIASPFAVLRALCHGHLDGKSFDLSRMPEALDVLEKMDLSGVFWGLMEREFDYRAESPSVAGLLRRIFVSELLHQAGTEGLESCAHQCLPPRGQRNSVVFLTQWRDSTGAALSYDAAAEAVSAEQKLGDDLGGLDLERLRQVYTFWEAEKRAVSGLKSRLLAQTAAIDLDYFRAVASERRAGHWLAGPGAEGIERRAVADAYDAIVAAAELFDLLRAHQHRWSFSAPGALLDAYRDELHRVDRLYRAFVLKAKPALGQGWDLLKALLQEVELAYDQQFLQPLGVEWSRLLDEGFLESWSLPEWPAQQAFFDDNIRPHLKASDRKRAFVVISDAFRFEAATELVEELNGREGMDAEVAAMLGVLPSYTTLGMASLLPHESLEYTDKGDVRVDGSSVASTDARGKQLAKFEGMACKAAALRGMTTAELREFTRDQRVVYVYHNVVDARGDSASTEDETFEAVRDCIRELIELVKICINKLNASKIWVTADHGFLFQLSAPTETDKSKLSHKPAQAVKVKKRYVVGKALGSSPEAHHGATKVTAGAEGGMEFWIPRAANRFHFTGGARFVHGGAMPQEVVVPVVTVSRLRGKDKEKSRVEKVTVQVLGMKHKITTPVYRFEFIQTEPVSDRRKPLTLRGAVYDGATAVTSIETVTFDSTSDSMDERKKPMRLKLQSGAFDKKKFYKLILRDADTDAEVHALPVVIDRSFDDDF